MSKYIGVRSTGIKLPILKEGDNLVNEVVKAVTVTAKKTHCPLQNRDVIAITESIVARTAGDYVTIDEIAADVLDKFTGKKELAVVFPILSRNRFSNILKGIAKAAKKLYIVLSYPCDEVGNHLVSDSVFYSTPCTKTVMTERDFRLQYGDLTHEFTGIDYIKYYKELVKEQGCEVQVILANDPTVALKYTKNVIVADIHTRFLTESRIVKAGGKIVVRLDQILSTPAKEGGHYNSKYGVLGSNKASETSLKLFPEHGQELVEKVQKEIFKRTKKKVEVMVYGDGAFKDPVGKIWELADPIVCPFHTDGLNGTPNEIKIKYFADCKFADKEGKDLEKAIKGEITNKQKDLVGNMVSEGTTPRHYTDLLGSLADLTSGSGDKGTPVVLIQNYFSNYSED